MNWRKILDGWSVSWSWKTWWGTPELPTIRVERTSHTPDGIFGVLTLDFDPFTCQTVENMEMAIPVGSYSMIFSYSPRFNRVMPEIIVPGRTGIRCHWANFPEQLKGCIALGDKRDGDSVDNSRITFNQFYSKIDGKEDMKIFISERNSISPSL